MGHQEKSVDLNPDDVSVQKVVTHLEPSSPLSLLRGPATDDTHARTHRLPSSSRASRPLGRPLPSLVGWTTEGGRGEGRGGRRGGGALLTGAKGKVIEMLVALSAGGTRGQCG
jgi:hypothetical protein